MSAGRVVTLALDSPAHSKRSSHACAGRSALGVAPGAPRGGSRLRPPARADAWIAPEVGPPVLVRTGRHPLPARASGSRRARGPHPPEGALAREARRRRVSQHPDVAARLQSGAPPRRLPRRSHARRAERAGHPKVKPGHPSRPDGSVSGELVGGMGRALRASLGPRPDIALRSARAAPPLHVPAVGDAVPSAHGLSADGRLVAPRNGPGGAVGTVRPGAGLGGRFGDPGGPRGPGGPGGHVTVILADTHPLRSSQHSWRCGAARAAARTELTRDASARRRSVNGAVSTTGATRSARP